MLNTPIIFEGLLIFLVSHAAVINSGLILEISA